MGLFSWFRERKRKKILAGPGIAPRAWAGILKQHPILASLDPEEKKRLREYTLLFLAEKQILFKEGMREDEATRQSIAVQACLTVLGLGIDWMDGWRTIYVVPGEFGHTDHREVAPGFYELTEEEASGEVMSLGAIALSLPDIEASGWGDGYNVVIHEIAHKLDGRKGAITGCPPLHPGMDPTEWKRVMRSAFEDLRRRIDGSRGTPRLPIDEYAAESIEEFFAVASEAFFETPVRLKRAYPEMYRQLEMFYRPGNSSQNNKNKDESTAK
jgi:MtfA peptidase